MESVEINTEENSITVNNDTDENIIIKAGWGPCHYFIIGLCAMCTMAEAGASMIVIIVIALLACDVNYSKKDVMTLNAIASLGMALGNLLFGILCDYNGRKNLIAVSMIVIFCASVGLSFSQTYFLISFSVFVMGVGAAGNNLALRVYLIECLPTKKRGSCLALIDLFWIFGYILALGISWLIIPSIIQMISNEFRPSSWRVLIGFAGAPNLIMACIASLLPSSPRYLIHHRRPEQALIILQQMFAINNSQHVANFSPIDLNDYSRSNDEEISTDDLMHTIKHFLFKVWRPVILIFSFQFIGSTLLLLIIRLFLFPGFIWLALWKTHVLIYQTITYIDSTLIIDQTCYIDHGNMTMNFLDNCHQVNNIQFEYLLITSSSFIIGEILLAFGIDVIGRRLPLVMSGLIGGISILAITFTNHHHHHHHAKIVFSILFLISYSIINTTTNIIQLESYPTAVRGTIFGLTATLPHLLSFFIKFIEYTTCTKSLYIAFGFLIGATVAAIPLSDLTNVPMQE